MPPLMTKRQLREWGTSPRVGDLQRKLGINPTIKVRGTVRCLRQDIVDLLYQHIEKTTCQR
jgi:hypothetical protein